MSGMSRIDPEVLYLILTKVAAKETFYNFDAKSGTITPEELSEVYGRITSNRPGARLNWGAQVAQLDEMLKKCGLPSLGAVVGAGAPEAVSKAHATKWPAFSTLKNLYGRRG